MKRYCLTIRGRVQGVYYRATAKSKAIELGLSGFVRNMPNGDVYLEATGERELLEELVKWAWQGPALARVLSVDVTEAEPGTMDEFEIRR